MFHEEVTKYVDSIEVFEGLDHLCPEFWGDMLGNQGVGGLDFREVRHCGVGLQQFKIELGKKLWMSDFSRALIGCGC